jgi:hypothetical protein
LKSPQSSTNVAGTRNGAVLSLIAGVVAVLVIDLVASLTGNYGDFSHLGIAAFLFFLVAIFIGRVYGADSGVNPLCIGLGIAVGMFVDANIVDFAVRERRGFWPMLIVVYWVAGALPAAAGFLLGGLWRSSITKSSTDVNG